VSPLKTEETEEIELKERGAEGVEAMKSQVEGTISRWMDNSWERKKTTRVKGKRANHHHLAGGPRKKECLKGKNG